MSAHSTHCDRSGYKKRAAEKLAPVKPEPKKEEKKQPKKKVVKKVSKSKKQENE